MMWSLVGILLTGILTGCVCQPTSFPTLQEVVSGNETDEERLFRHLFKNYQSRRFILPVTDRTKPIQVHFDAHLLGLAKVNEKEQNIKTHLWIKEKWVNPFLTWSPEDYDNIKEINVPLNMLWVPDIILLNNADDRNDAEKKSNEMITVKHDGTNIWRSPAIYNSMCVLDVKYFPFDEQLCDLVLASWTRDGSTLKLILDDNTVTRSGKDTKFFQENEEWRVLYVKIKREEVKYEWSDNTRGEITISLKLERRTYYYVMNLILPCTLIACTIFLEFILPAESGERVGLGITILLSMAVFQELTSEKLPSSSEHFPLLAMYYSVSIMEIGTALAATCVILNIYHRKTDMPGWFRKIVLCWLATIVRCKPRCTSKEMLDTKHEEAMMNIMSFKSGDVRRNDNYEFDRESHEFEMDVIDPCSQGRSTQREQHGHAPNGSVPCGNVQRRHSMRGGHDDDLTNQDTSAVDPLFTHRIQLSERLNEDVRRKEWQDAARVLDRVLLVVSVVIGSASAMAIFLQSPRIRGFFNPWQ